MTPDRNKHPVESTAAAMPWGCDEARHVLVRAFPSDWVVELNQLTKAIKQTT